MTDFQIVAASSAILLEVFFEEVGGDETWARVRDRMIEGSYWSIVGGLEGVERRLKNGFTEDFGGATDKDGKSTTRSFPTAILDLLRELRRCDNRAESVTDKARTVVPILRRFVAGHYEAPQSK